MFIRAYKTKNRKTGTEYIAHRLVEAYQTEKGPRQRIVMHLGELSLPRSEWRALATALEARLSGQTSLLTIDPQIDTIAAQAIEHYELVQSKNEDKLIREKESDFAAIDMNTISTTESRTVGPEIVADSIWESLNLDTILKNCKFDLKQISIAKAMIIGRLISPSSELSTIGWIKNSSSIIEMLHVNIKDVGKDSFYEIADQLLSNKEEIEKQLRAQELKIFPQKPTILLYDLTNAYFEGTCLKNDLASNGKSKEKRTDCPLVTLALVVDSFGFPVMSQVYEGNQSEPKTLKDILDNLGVNTNTLFDNIKPTIAMDRGIATKENIELLRSEAYDYDYVVVERRAVEKDYIKEFETAKETFEKIDFSKKSAYGDLNHVYVKKMESDKCSKVLCVSEGRKTKETAIDNKKEERFLEDISKIQKSIDKKNVGLVPKVYERIGRAKQKYASIAKHYDIDVVCDETFKKVISIQAVKKPSKEERAKLTGCYVIETTHRELEAKEVWKLYTTLTNVESAFKSLKSDLGLRPVYHQNAERTKGHLFIAVLAYHLLINIERKLRENGDTRKWSTIRDVLSTHQRNTVILTDDDKKIHHIRVSGTPESSHTEIYRLLDIRFNNNRIHKLGGIRL